SYVAIMPTRMVSVPPLRARSSSRSPTRAPVVSAVISLTTPWPAAMTWALSMAETPRAASTGGAQEDHGRKQPGRGPGHARPAAVGGHLVDDDVAGGHDLGALDAVDTTSRIDRRRREDHRDEVTGRRRVHRRSVAGDPPEPDRTAAPGRRVSADATGRFGA